MKSKADEMIDEAIQSVGLRVTRQRRAIYRVLADSGDRPDANEVHRRARVFDPKVSLATTYRTLAELADKGVVEKLTLEGEPSRFETNDTPHHDHIVDLDSGEVVEFISAEIEKLQRKVAWAHGYDIVSHKLQLYCRKRSEKSG